MRHLAVGADDSVLREFAELDVVVVCERVSESKNRALHSAPTRTATERTSSGSVRLLLHAEDTVHAPESRAGAAPGRGGEHQLPVLTNTPHWLPPF